MMGIQQALRRRMMGAGGGLYTNFATKGPGWTESGGAFQYTANGLYHPAGGTNGALRNANGWYNKTLVIPLASGTPGFDMEMSFTVSAPSAANMGGFYCYVQGNGGGYNIAGGGPNDAGAGSATYSYYLLGAGYIQYNTLSMSRVMRMVCDGVNLTYYMDGVAAGSYTFTTPPPSADRIYIEYDTGYRDNYGSYYAPSMCIHYIDLKFL